MASPKQLAAQLAATLPDQKSQSYVEQLFCFNPSAITNFFSFHPPFTTWPLPGISATDTPTYPYITGGLRKCTLDTSQKRSTIWDTTCSMTITLSAKSGKHPEIHTDANTTTSLTNTVTVTISGKLQANYQDVSKISAAIKSQYSLDQSILDNWHCCVWFVQIVPTTISNNGPASLQTAINTAVSAFLKEDSASLFIPLALASSDEKFDQSDYCLNKLGVAIAPCQDADGTDQLNNIYFVLQPLPANGQPDRSGPTAPWVQQWCVPGDVQNCVLVLPQDNLWTLIYANLIEATIQSSIDDVVAGWPTKPNKNWPSPPPKSVVKPWLLERQKGDFNWVPKNSDPTPDTEASVPCAGYNRVCDNQNNVVNGQELAVQIVHREIHNRLYYTPGYTDSQGKDVGARLPMQTFFETDKPKWQAAFMGKNTFTFSDEITEIGAGPTPIFYDQATYEVFWLMFFNFREFLQGDAGFTTSDVYTQNNYLKGSANVQSLLDANIQHESNTFTNWLKTSGFQEKLKNAITVNMKISVPAAAQVNDELCFYNNNGDLIVPFSYG